ncbi:MAG: quinoprotein dehydrogenase-associated transporter substrate-binding protein [Gemmatimonadetes bacterium]|jgi:mxaJ protein|nr:quinoprotein dehydrogenase-associated transporter substrate-binding protein [Gemmatimonadota bacterium]
MRLPAPVPSSTPLARSAATLGLAAFLALVPRVLPAQFARTLRVCADPNNLPFSNAREEGFENRIAQLVARELHASVQYTWWAQRRGFSRNTLRAGSCDLFIGVPSGFEPVLATRPYYRSTYAFVTRRNGPHITSFDDPRLRTLRVGVQLVGDDYANTPPAQALTNRGIIRNVRGYTVIGNYLQPNPPSRIVRAVADGEVDVAIVWGPLAGYFAKHATRPLRVVPVSPEIDLPYLPFVFDMAMGVRRGDTTFRNTLDSVIVRRRGEIDAILREYGVPVK